MEVDKVYFNQMNILLFINYMCRNEGNEEEMIIMALNRKKWNTWIKNSKTKEKELQKDQLKERVINHVKFIFKIIIWKDQVNYL